MSVDQFPLELIQQYKLTSSKLKKFQRVVFKRFGPNVSEISEEFNLLALNFDNSFLSQYAGLCWLGSAKCEKALGNTLTEVDALLKSARAFVKYDREIEKLKVRSNNREHLEGALRCYNQAAARLEDDSVMKVAIIREVKKINPNAENTSNFNSPSHRIYDLEQSANVSISAQDFVGALEKLTEIFDDINERKVEDYYADVLVRNEIARLILLLILELPPSRQSPSHIKLLENYSSVEESGPQGSCQKLDELIPKLLVTHLKNLVMACDMQDKEYLIETRGKISESEIITMEHNLLLDHLVKRF